MRFVPLQRPLAQPACPQAPPVGPPASAFVARSLPGAGPCGFARTARRIDPFRFCPPLVSIDRAEVGPRVAVQRPRPAPGHSSCAPVSRDVPDPCCGSPGWAWPVVRLLLKHSHFSHESGDAHGVCWSFAVLLRRAGLRTIVRPNPLAVRPHTARMFFVPGRRRGILNVGFPAGRGPRDAATGFSRGPAVPRRRIGEAATALDFSPLPGLRTPGLRLIGCNRSSAWRPGPHARPSIGPGLDRRLSFRRARPSAPGLWARMWRACPSACCRADA